MRFGWADPTVRNLCTSQFGLQLAFPAVAEDAELLLHMVHKARNVEQLQGFAAVRLFVEDRPDGQSARIHVAIGAADLVGVPLLNIQGRAIAISRNHGSSVEAAEALYVEELRIHGRASNSADS